MTSPGPVHQVLLDTIAEDGRKIRITLHTVADGIEYVGRLFFADSDWTNNGIPDRGVIPGRTADDVLARARGLSLDELRLRYRRANAEKRRYHALRGVTLELLAKVRYQNRVAVSIRKGLLEPAAGQHELESTEEEMIALVRQMKNVAGVES